MKRVLLILWVLLVSIGIKAQNQQATTDPLIYYVDSEYDENAALVGGLENDGFEGTVTIPEQITTANGVVYPVKGIGDHAFKSRKVKVILSPTIEHIDESALEGVELEEEVYLPNLQIVGYAAMHKCTGVKKLRIGSKLKRVGEGAFAGIKADEMIIESDGDTSKNNTLWIAKDAFNDATSNEILLPQRYMDLSDEFCCGENIKRIVFPDVEEIKYGAVNCWCPFDILHSVGSKLINKAKEVVCLSSTPPQFKIPQLFFEGAYYNQPSTHLHITGNMDECILKVPAGSESLYRNDPIWGTFKTIHGFTDGDYTKINTPQISTHANECHTVYYNLQGLEVRQPIPGQLYIRRNGATSEKIIY